MNKYRVLSRILSSAAIVTGVVMCIHVWADYSALSAQPMTNSAPPWVSFLIAIPYALAILITLVLAVICARKYKRSETDK